MSPILDRFRTQPRHRHPDPIVRLAFVQELPIDEHDLLSEIAKGDEDARVRRAAAAKLMQPRTLAEIVRDDADESVRGQAAAMLRMPGSSRRWRRRRRARSRPPRPRRA